MKDNKLWVATEFGGIAILDLSQRLYLSSEQIHFQYIEEGADEYGLSSSSVRFLFQDSFSNVWAGTWGGGISFLNHESSLFNRYNFSPIPTDAKSLTGKMISSICADHRGKLWIGTEKGDLNVFEKGRRTVVYSMAILCSHLCATQKVICGLDYFSEGYAIMMRPERLSGNFSPMIWQ